MIEPTVDRPNGQQPDITSGYLEYLTRAAIDFVADIGGDPGQVTGMADILLSPVDTWE